MGGKVKTEQAKKCAGWRKGTWKKVRGEKTSLMGTKTEVKTSEK